MKVIGWTHHPLVDVGIATLCVMSNRQRPEEITIRDLDTVTDELADIYFSGVMISYLTCVFMNSAYVQPAMKDEGRLNYRARILKAYREPVASKTQPCSFCGEPSLTVVHRGQIPMLTGEETLNFFPTGLGGLPVCGTCLTAIQALPMGCKRVEGKLFAAHADDPALTIALAQVYVEDNRRLIALAKAGRLTKDAGPAEGLDREISAGDKYPDSKSPSSLITADLLKVFAERQQFRDGSLRSPSITCYWLSSSGQGPSLDVFYLPSNLIRFLRLVSQAAYREGWQRLVGQSWRTPSKAGQEADSSKKKRGKERKSVAIGGPGRSRNDVLDDLVRIYRDGHLEPQDARRFVSRHLLRHRRSETGIAGLQAPEEVNWPLTQLFLKEVLGMIEERIGRIRRFADNLADHIASANDRKLFRGVVYSTRPFELRNALTRAQRTEAADRNKLLFGLSDYIDVFEADEAAKLGDWSLTRDLISIRLVENLHSRGYFQKNADLLSESATDQAS